MPDLLIRLKRHADGSASITCTRRDGSVTWQRQKGQLGVVFPPHDLTHYAVETTLGYRDAFYGMLADGWAIGDFAPPYPRGPIPREAREVELIVAFFDTQRVTMSEWAADEFNAHARRYVDSQRQGRSGVVDAPQLSAEQIARVMECRGGLLARWAAVRAGEALELAFERAGAGGSRPSTAPVRSLRNCKSGITLRPPAR